MAREIRQSFGWLLSSATKGESIIDTNDPTTPKRREQIGDELMEVLRQAQSEWSKTSEDNRDVARQRFITTLHVFDGLFLDNNNPPENCK